MEEDIRALQKAIGETDDETTPELAEIALWLDEYRGKESPSDEDNEGLLEHLQDTIDRLEATHPEISTAMARVVDSLTAFGL